MQRLKRVLAWLADHWVLPLVAVVGAAAFLAGRRQPNGARRTPVADVRHELRAARAGAEARIYEIERGTDAAVERILAQKASAIRKLEEGQREQAQRLVADPRALARYLARVGS